MKPIYRARTNLRILIYGILVIYSLGCEKNTSSSEIVEKDAIKEKIYSSPALTNTSHSSVKKSGETHIESEFKEEIPSRLNTSDFKELLKLWGTDYIEIKSKTDKKLEQLSNIADENKIMLDKMSFWEREKQFLVMNLSQRIEDANVKIYSNKNLSTEERNRKLFKWRSDNRSIVKEYYDKLNELNSVRKPHISSEKELVDFQNRFEMQSPIFYEEDLIALEYILRSSYYLKNKDLETVNKYHKIANILVKSYPNTAKYITF